MLVETIAMRYRYQNWFENIDAPTIYSPEQYQQLSSTPGSPDEAADRLDVSKTEIRELCTRLAVGDEVADDAIQLYQQVIRTNLVNNYLNGSLICATVYTACRKHQVPRTLDDIDAAAYVRVEPDNDAASQNQAEDYQVGDLTMRIELPRAYNQIRDRFDRRYPPVAPEKFARWYCDELGLEEQVVEFVQTVIKRVDGEAVSGVEPNSIAAGAIYYASQELDLGMTRREIEVITQCSESTIGNIRNLIQDSIEP